MDKQSFEQTIALSVFVGAFVITFYDMLQSWIRLLYTNTAPTNDFYIYVVPKEYAGLIVGSIGLGYYLVSRFSRKKGNDVSSQDSTKHKNEKSFAKSNQENNNVESHTRARICAHIIITIFFLGLVFVAMLYLIGYRDTTYNYTPIDHANETFGFVKNINTGESIPQRLDYYVHLSTTSLSAQNKIDVSAKAYEGLTFDHRLDYAWGTSDIPDTLCLVFPNALPFEEQPNGAGGFYGVVIPMKEDKDNHWYYGEASIKYPFEGQNGYTFLDYNNTGLYSPTCDKTTAQLSNLYNTTKIKQSIQDDNKYFVGSTNLTDALKTNDMTTALTLILIAFGFLEFRGIIRSGFIWLAERRS